MLGPYFGAACIRFAGAPERSVWRFVCGLARVAGGTDAKDLRVLDLQVLELQVLEV